MYQAICESLEIPFAELILEPKRLFHGRGQWHEGLEHINIDWYPPVLLISAYKNIEEVDSLVRQLATLDKKDQLKSIVYQERFKRGAPSTCIWGEKHPKVVVLENELKFEVQPGLNQNAGFFLDMRPLRGWLKANSAGKNVLNLFAYTCSLSVAALGGSARQVVNVDMSKSSIAWGERNHRLNDHEARAVRSVPHNLFKSWGRVQKLGPFDTVIIDPPTRQVGSFDAERDYTTVLKKLDKICKPKADIIATINSPHLNAEYLPNLMRQHQAAIRLLGNFPVSPEFADKYPDKALKIYHFRRD